VCGTRYSRESSHLLVADEQRPEGRSHSELRASDEERERAATLLRDHCAAGRLTTEELDERLGVAYRARTRGELDELLHDLPGAVVAPEPERTPVPWRPARVRGAVLALAAVLVVLAVATDGHTAWLFWPLAFIWLRRGWCARRRGPWAQGRTPGVRWL
jgi:hypothetical protein